MTAPAAGKFLVSLADDVARADVIRNLARTALNDAIHFGRPQAVIDDLARKLAALESPSPRRIEVPGPVLDPVSVEYAAVGGPRSWAEERVLKAAGEQALASADGPSGEALDAIRTNELMRARLERLTPEQRAQSIASVAFQALDDDRAAKMQQVAAAERRRAQMEAVANSIGSVASRYALPAVAAGLTAGGVGYAVNQKRQSMANDRAYYDELARRAETHANTRRAIGETLDSMGGDVSIDYGGDQMADMVNDITAPDIRGVPSPEPDIFTEDPAISWESDDPGAAIKRVLQKRYGS